ncbi:MAG: ribbon-helix-helix domain-containing protein [Thermoleophilia bacterium]
MTTQVPVRLTDRDLALLDALVAGGRYANRSDALRAALARLADEERGREIDAAYARGYGEHPQEEWVAQAGLAGLVAFDAANGGEAL